MLCWSGGDVQGAGQQAWVWSRRHRLEQGLGLSWATGARTWFETGLLYLHAVIFSLVTARQLIIIITVL
jgi:hypothetical protein